MLLGEAAMTVQQYLRSCVQVQRDGPIDEPVSGTQKLLTATLINMCLHLKEIYPNTSIQRSANEVSISRLCLDVSLALTRAPPRKGNILISCVPGSCQFSDISISPLTNPLKICPLGILLNCKVPTRNQKEKTD